MNTPEHISLSLTKLLDRLSAALSNCDPENAEAVSALTRDLGQVRSSLEYEQTAHLGDLAGVAVRLADHLACHGQVGPRQTLDLIEQTVNGIRSGLGLGEPGTSVEEVQGHVKAETSHLTLLDGKRIGELLVTLSMLSPTDVERALTLQKQTGMLLGEALVELSILHRGAIESALRLQTSRRRREVLDDPWALPG